MNYCLEIWEGMGLATRNSQLDWDLFCKKNSFVHKKCLL